MHGLRNYTQLIFHKAYADFRAQADQTYLGLAWWVLEPLINLGVYYLVFGVFLKNRASIENYVPYLLTGLVAFRWFEQSVMRAAKSILANGNLVRQVAFKKVVFPLIAATTCTMEFVFSLALLFTLLWSLGYEPAMTYGALPVVLCVELLLILACSLWLSAIMPFLPDLANLLNHVMRVLFFMSAIVFTWEQVPGSYQQVLVYNPLIWVIQSYRDILMYDRYPHWPTLAIIAAASAAFILFGIVLIRRFDGLYAKWMVQ